MIVINHINGVVSEKDIKLIPKEYVSRHSNGSEWIYFETNEEYESYKDENFPKFEEIQEKQENPLLTALKGATPEEIAEFKELLK